MPAIGFVARRLVVCAVAVVALYAATKTTFRLRRAWRNMQIIEAGAGPSVFTPVD